MASPCADFCEIHMYLQHHKTVILIFSQTGQLMCKVQNEMHLHLKVTYDFHYANFHETLSYSTTLHGALLH